MLADEPTGELDTATSHEIFDVLRRSTSELGVTIVVVTHDPLVSEQVNRTVAIRDGRTSSETLRRRAREEGDHQVIARSSPCSIESGGCSCRAHVEALEMERRVRLELEADHIGVWPDGHGPRPTADGATRAPADDEPVRPAVAGATSSADRPRAWSRRAASHVTTRWARASCTPWTTSTCRSLAASS